MATRLRIRFVIAPLRVASCLSHGGALAKQSSSINRPENRESYASVGDVLVKVTLRESLPNAFGRADVFGRKRDRGFVEIRFMGLSDDGRAIFRRRTVDIYSTETTMTRSGLRYGTARVEPDGNGASITGYSVGGQQATVQALPPDTIEFALDLSKNRIVTVEDRVIEILEADAGGAKFKIGRR
jgi:hypothetical protein